MPVSTNAVATAIVPAPHIGRTPVTSMNRTPRVRVGTGGRLEDRAGHPAGSPGLADEQSAQVIAVREEVLPPLLHGGSREGARASSKMATRTGSPGDVEVDGVQQPGGSHGSSFRW